MISLVVKNAVDAYSGGPVDRELVQAALDFMVAIQPPADDPDGGEKYAVALDEHADTIGKAQAVFRAFGEAVEPRTLEVMQQIFYKLVDSPRYSADEARSCVYACLNRAWRGIGPWQG